MAASTISPTVIHRTRRISRLEIGAAALYVVVLLVLLAREPDILQAPFESARAVVVTFGGGLLAIAALAVMMRLGVAPLLRVLVIGVPVVLASWWLLEPFFVDDVVNERFSTSIAAEERKSAVVPSTVPDANATPTPPAVAAGPQLLGSGSFVGLAGHDGTGNAGIFRLEDGSLVVRLENFDIDNGPDLELYLVPGTESYSPGDESVHLGPLKGNVGNQTYDVPQDFEVGPGPWTVLVWCESFTVEFVGASVTVA
jgi:hypothetical protein